MNRLLAVMIVLVIAVTGCSKQSPADKTVKVADDDARMNAAIEKARSSVNTFIAALAAPKQGQSGFSVKMPFTDGDHTEHMWLTPVAYDGTTFHGTVNNVPEKIKTVKIGQKVTVAANKISDWMYVENRKLVGGYTIRAIRDALTPAERAEFDKSAPFVIE